LRGGTHKSYQRNAKHIKVVQHRVSTIRTRDCHHRKVAGRLAPWKSNGPVPGGI
jgi:hypothetical protein